MNINNIHIILESIVGSKAYGLSTESSDTDRKGFGLAPKEYYISHNKRFEQIELSSDKEDRTIYNITKFFTLAEDCNPNILDVLFVNEKDILSITPVGEEVLANRDIFISKKAKHTFSGYAFAQLKRIKTHRNWLLSPPLQEPIRDQFHLPNHHRLLSSTDMGILSKLEEVDHQLFQSALNNITYETYQNEKSYNAARGNWEKFQNWKATRNPQRAALEKQHGYDTKHAMHLVRLLRMGKEILSGVGVLVQRPDREELLAIRNGNRSYEDLIEEVEKLNKDMDVLYISSQLPHKPNSKKIEDLCCKILDKHLNNSRSYLQ